MKLLRKSSKTQQTETGHPLPADDKFTLSSLAYQLDKEIASRQNAINMFITKYPPGDRDMDRYNFISLMVPGYEFRTGDNSYKISNNKACYIHCVEIIKEMFPSAFMIDYIGFIRLLRRFDLICYSTSRFGRKLSNETVDGLADIWNKLINRYSFECHKVPEILKIWFPEKCSSSFPIKRAEMFRISTKGRLIDNINLNETGNSISFILVTPFKYTDNTVMAVKLLNYGVVIFGIWENQ